MNFADLLSVKVAIDGGLAHIILNRPDRGNPIDHTFCREIKEPAAELSERDEVRAILLTAKGRFFSVGGDIKSFARVAIFLAKINREQIRYNQITGKTSSLSLLEPRQGQVDRADARL